MITYFLLVSYSVRYLLFVTMEEVEDSPLVGYRSDGKEK
jgi:hypothetical protein